MKRVILLSLSLFASVVMTAQTKENNANGVKEVPFNIIEEVPIYPGCKGDQPALKKCFTSKVQRHIAQNFNARLPQRLKLPPGRKNIVMLFKIASTGKVEDISVTAPHPKLVKECKRILKKLPRFKPGRNGGKAIGVRFSVPLTIDVE